MNEQNKKSNRSALIGAAFIMATSAIGPGFLIQTAKFVGDFKGAFGFVIVISVLLSIVVQLNVWRVLCVSGLRGQDVANKILPGLGHIIAFMIVAGGLIFNIGNVGGIALGFNTVTGLDLQIGYIISGTVAMLIFLSKNAQKVLDTVTKTLGAIMIVVIFVVALITKAPMGMALKETFAPSTGVSTLFPAILTLLGGTVGGYITFAGAHRLIDAKITGKENLKQISQSSVMGIGVAAIVRVLLFLAVLGVVVKGVVLDPANPAADAFRQGAGEIGYRFFGLLLLAHAPSVAVVSYTSISFLKTLSKTVAKHEKAFTIGFIILSTLGMMILGKPAKLLVLAGALNGFVLPLTLGVCLIASRRKDIMGDSYKHPIWLFVLGVITVILSAYLGITSLSNLSTLFA